ncbi:MAG: Hpt domain-containing protein [Candidatus Electrothrix scaldis]|nr:MAG: Hpt domain-containing protein [Candidatus Electrothrix sp. GW3-3]
MSSSVGNDIVTGFLEEVEGYLPDMNRCLQVLQQDKADRSSLAELHRITHTIKGAAAMVGLDDLSAMGEVMEKVMENVLGSSLVLDEETMQLVGAATRQIDQYCVMQRDGSAHDEQLFQNTIAELEKKLSQSTTPADLEADEGYSPESIFFEQDSEELVPEEGGPFDLDEDAEDDLFLGADTAVSEEDSSESFLDSLSLAEDEEEDLDNELLLVNSDEDEDDLFASALTEPEQSEQNQQEQSTEDLFHSVESVSPEEEMEDIDAELLECFREETEDHLENVDQCLNNLTAQISKLVKLTPSTREELHSLRRSVHTLKGAAAVIGIPQVAAWGHDFEDFLDWLHDEAQQLDPLSLVALRDGADLLASLVDDPTQATDAAQQQIMVKFADITEAFTSSLSAVSDEAEEAQPAFDALDDRAEDFVLSEDDADGFLDEIAASAGQPEDSGGDGIEDELFLQDQDVAEDDLFGTAVTDLAESSEEILPSAEADIDPIDPELLECFQEETEEHLESIETCLKTLGEEVTDAVQLTPSTQETLHIFRRAVHTLKGAAAVIGIEPVADWGRDFEDFLDWLHDEAKRLDPSIIDHLRESAKLLASLAHDPAFPAQQEKQRLIAIFSDITEAFSTGAENQDGVKEKVSFSQEQGSEEDADLFAETELEEDEAEDFFDVIGDDTASVDEDDALFQETDEEEDLFGSVLAGLAESPESFSSDTEESAAEPIDPELLECFREETDEHLENIDNCLTQLSQEITAPMELTSTSRETLHSLRRSVHTLKGAAAVIGIEQIAAWGHDFEDFLDWLHDEAQKLAPPIITLLQDGADVLADLADNPSCPVAKRKSKLAAEFNHIMVSDRQEEALQDKGESSLDEPDDFFVELPDSSRKEIDDDPFAVQDSTADELKSGPHEDVAQEAEADIDPELLQCFHEEAEEHLDSIDRQLNHLGMTVSGEAELTDLKRGSLHSIRRSVHTLKGAASVIGIEPVAAWGHDFEDFLDWLHDEAQVIRPVVIKAMQKGADILTRLVEAPGVSVSKDQKSLLEQFGQITTGNLTETSPNESKEDVAAAEASSPQVTSKQVIEPKKQAAPAPQSQRKRTATLRVDVDRIDQLVGLSGDMVINLSSFEDSMDAMSGTMKELDMILQRLKNINSSLEAGYELASIPHIGGVIDAQASGITEDFDPLEMDRYSELNILIRSLTEAVSDLDSIMAQNAMDNVTWQKTVERQGMVLKDLQNRMMGIRMTPLSTLSSRMHRTVREAERTTGHPAQLIIEGESIMMDTRVWDVMADPLMHILRNSVAHGGRLPQEAGWTPLSITIKAIRKGGQCVLRVKDTGKGLDYEAIRVKGMKLYPNDRVNLMNDHELADLIFRHGFSSTGSVTNIAGRGVGMDVVRDAIDQLNGSIELISERGQGTEFVMRLPVAVAQLPAILARFGHQVYAVPMHDVESVVRATPDEKMGREYTFDGEPLPLLHPAKVPGFETDGAYLGENITEADQALLIVHTGRKRAAVLCEQLIGQRDIVFKDLGAHLHNVPCISGVTIMGDGSLIPILQIEEVLHKWASVIKGGEDRPVARPVPEREGPLRVLVVDDSISVRKVVSNFITQQGWIPVAARNGIEAMEKIREERPSVVLLDVEMPRMNGFEVLQALQAQAELRDIPVAMLTSRSADKYQEKARELGARGFMTKPFKSEEVIGFIQKVTADEQV